MEKHNVGSGTKSARSGVHEEKQKKVGNLPAASVAMGCKTEVHERNQWKGENLLLYLLPRAPGLEIIKSSRGKRKPIFV